MSFGLMFTGPNVRPKIKIGHCDQYFCFNKCVIKLQETVMNGYYAFDFESVRSESYNRIVIGHSDKSFMGQWFCLESAGPLLISTEWGLWFKRTNPVNPK